MSEAQTQTSPESGTTAMKNSLPMNNVTNHKEDRHASSGRHYRREHTPKTLKARSKRNVSPVNAHQQVLSPTKTLNFTKEKVFNYHLFK